MRKLLLAAALIAAALAPAVAADQASPRLKALPPAKATCPVGTGWYGGVNTYAQAANGTVAGTSVTADGAAVGLTAGYAWGDCVSGRFMAIEGLFDYQNLGGSTTSPAITTVSASLNSHYEFTQRFKIGTNLSDVMTFLPNFGTVFPGFPTPAAGTSNPKAYVAAVLREADVSAAFLLPSGHVWSFEPGIGAGIQSQTPNGSVVDVFMDYTFKGGDFTAGLPGGASANLGGVARFGVQVLY